MAKATRQTSPVAPDQRDAKIIGLETTTAVLQQRVDELTGEIGDARRHLGKLEEVSAQWKKVAEDRAATVTALRDHCAELERQFAELTGYTKAVVETLERVEGVPAQAPIPPEPLRRQIPNRSAEILYGGARSSTQKPWWRV